jgi:voltage-gated potassium channel Kch
MIAALPLQKLDDSEIWHTYVAAMYWAMSTMTTVGYGDIVPQHTGERIWCMVGMLVGVTAFAYFMSSVASVAAAMNSHSNRMASQRAELDDFLTNAKVRCAPRERF